MLGCSVEGKPPPIPSFFLFVTFYGLFLSSIANSPRFWFNSLFSFTQYMLFTRSKKIDHNFTLSGFLFGFIWSHLLAALWIPAIGTVYLLVLVSILGIVCMLEISLVLKYTCISDDFDYVDAATAIGWGLHISVNAHFFYSRPGLWWWNYLSENLRCIYPLLGSFIGADLALHPEAGATRCARGACVLHVLYLVLIQVYGNFFSNFASLICFQVASIVLWLRCRKVVKSLSLTFFVTTTH